MRQSLTFDDLHQVANVSASSATDQAAINQIFNKGGNDKLFGDDGADTVVGGLGDDYLEGGEGFDTALWFGQVAN